MLTEASAHDSVVGLLPRYRDESEHLDTLNDYLHGDHPGPYKPKTANKEYELLIKRSTSNWLPLIIDAVAQALYVEGYRRADEPDDAAGWDYWQSNGLDARQQAIMRSALAYGHCYVTVLPGRLGTDPTPVIRGVSPRRMLAVYDDPGEDDWPQMALRVDTEPNGNDGRYLFRLYDEKFVYHFRADSLDADELTYVDTQEHGVGVCPVVRFASMIDLEGRTRGEIEPLMPVQDRINQTTFDLLIAQTFGSFKIRGISGMAPEPLKGPDGKVLLDDEGNPRVKPLPIDQRRFVMAPDPDTKAWQLDETELKGYLDSLDLSVRHLAAISQTPPHHLLGQMANLSAEALAAAEAGLTRKVEERRHSFGESWEQVLRLACLVGGDPDGAADTSAQVVWRDTEARSMSQTVDALGKAVQMLGVPAEALWERIPGVTSTDVERWRSLAQENDGLAQFAATLERQATEAGDQQPAEE